MNTLFISLLFVFSVFNEMLLSFLSSIGMTNNNQTNVPSFSSSSLLTLVLSPVDHDHILRCQVTNEASVHDTNVEVKLDVLCE